MASTHPDAVVLRAFNWPFARVTKEMASLAKIGYTHVLVSPPTLSNPNKAWWARYQPVDYRIFSEELGSKQEFKEMTEAGKKAGVDIVADVVLNHMADMQETADYSFPHAAWRDKYKVDALFTREHFHDPFCIRNYNNATEVRNGQMCSSDKDRGLPDLDQKHPHVLKVQREYLRSLWDLGAKGFRFDAMKHMEPWYFNQVLEFDRDLTGFLNLGEIIFDRKDWNRDFEPYYKATSGDMKFYDFPLFMTMKRAFELGGDLQSLKDVSLFGDGIARNRSVGFVLNHDIPQNKWEHFYVGKHTREHGDPTDERLLYTFLLGRSGAMSYMYTDDGLENDFALVSGAYRNMHCSRSIVALMTFQKSLRGEPQTFIDIGRKPNQLVWTRGKRGFVALNKSGEVWGVPADLKLGEGLQGAFVDLNSGQQFEVNKGKVHGLKVKGRQAVVALRKDALPEYKWTDLVCDSGWKP